MAPLFLEKLEVKQFRNLLPGRLSFSTGLNLFFGDNAQGKTNLLEAVHIATALKAFRAGHNRELIAWGLPEANVQGILQTDVGERHVEVRLREGGKQILVDGKASRSFLDFSSQVKVVLFTPEEMQLIRGTPSVRRKYLDNSIFHLYPRYADILKSYQQVILHKNRILSQGIRSGIQLDVWQERQVDLGSRVIAARARFIRRIRESFENIFKEINGTNAPAGLRYKLSQPELGEGLMEGHELRERFRQAMQRVAGEEIRRGVTIVGPHRDDLEVVLEERDAAVYASQGQARMLSLCLKIVELKVLLEDQGTVPILLLDDVSSELDEHRNRYLMEYVARVGCQVFLTTTSLRHISREAFSDVSSYHVAGGRILSECAAKSRS